MPLRLLANSADSGDNSSTGVSPDRRTNRLGQAFLQVSDRSSTPGVIAHSHAQFVYCCATWVNDLKHRCRRLVVLLDGSPQAARHDGHTLDRATDR